MGVGNSKFEVGKRYYAKDRTFMDFIIFDAWDDRAGRNVVMTFFPSGGGREPHIFREDFGSPGWYGRFLEGKEDDKYQDTPRARLAKRGETWKSRGRQITCEHLFYKIHGGELTSFALLVIADKAGEFDPSFAMEHSKVFDRYPED